jgi:hypothetical protein
VPEQPGSAEAFWQEWMTLLDLSGKYMAAAEAIIEGLQGHLGVDTREDGAMEKAAVEIQRRLNAYIDARNAMVKYARDREALLS